MATTITAVYDFSEDAMGLSDFINQNLSDEEVSPVVYVTDKDGNPAARAVWETTTLTDGSKVATLVIYFDR